MSDKLTLEKVEQMVAKLKSDHPEHILYGCKFVVHPMMQGNEILIKSGNTLFCCKDFTIPESITVIEIPPID